MRDLPSRLRNVGRLPPLLLGLFLFPVAANALTLTSSTWPVKVEYGTAELEPLAGVVLVAAEQAWQHQIIDLGYLAPFDGAGPLPAQLGMTFVLQPTSMGAGGAMVQWGADLPDTPACDCSSTVIIDSRTAATEAAVSEGVFHELNHATQYAADCTEAPSAYEGFAVAAVHYRFPASTIVPWVIGQFQAFPEYPLDYWTMDFPCSGAKPCFPYQLGEALYPIYLAERFGQGDPGALAGIFTRFSQTGTTTIGPPHPSCSAPNHPNWFEGVDQFLHEHGSSFDEAFAEFSAWRAIVGGHDDQAHFSRGASYAEPAIAGQVPLAESSIGTGEVHEYGTRFIEVTGLAEAAPGSWRVIVSGDPAATWSASLLIWRDQGPVERRPLAFAGMDGEVLLGSPSGMARLLLVVSQLGDGAHVPDEMDYANARSFSCRFELEPPPDSGLDGGADGADYQGPGDTQDGGMDSGQDGGDLSGTGCSCGDPVAAPNLLIALVFLADGLARRFRRL